MDFSAPFYIAAFISHDYARPSYANSNRKFRREAFLTSLLVVDSQIFLPSSSRSFSRFSVLRTSECVSVVCYRADDSRFSLYLEFVTLVALLNSKLSSFLHYSRFVLSKVSGTLPRFRYSILIII